MYSFTPVFIFLCISLSWSSEKFSESHKGPWQISHSGGGIAENSGLNSVFTNPAGLVMEQGQQFYFGTTDLLRGVPPLLMVGKRANSISSYAFTLFRTEAKGPDSVLQGVMGSFAIHSGSYFSMGAEVFTKILDGKTTVDLNSGLQYQLTQRLRLGLRVNNISESNIGLAKDSLDLQRSYGAGLVLNPFYKFKIYYDVISPELDIEKAMHLGALKVTFGNFRSFSFLNSYKMQSFSQRDISTGVGFTFNTKVSHNQLGFSYSLGGLPINHAQTDLSQAVSIIWSMNLFRDKRAPFVSVKDKYGVITPSQDTVTREAYFKMEAGDKESSVETWHFVICDVNSYGEAKNILRSFSGKGLPPKYIKWGGRDSFQNLVPKGFYAYRLIVKDKQGNLGRTEWQLIEMKE